MSFTNTPLKSKCLDHEKNSSVHVIHWTSTFSNTNCCDSVFCSVSFMPDPLNLSSTFMWKSQDKCMIVVETLDFVLGFLEQLTTLHS